MQILEARLQPFWFFCIIESHRSTILFTSEEAASIATALSTDDRGSKDSGLQPVITREVVTTQDGSFQMKFDVPWDLLCVHPTGLHIAFGDVKTDIIYSYLRNYSPLHFLLPQQAMVNSLHSLYLRRSTRLLCLKLVPRSL